MLISGINKPRMQEKSVLMSLMVKLGIYSGNVHMPLHRARLPDHAVDVCCCPDLCTGTYEQAG